MIIKRVGGKSKISGWIVQNLPHGSIFVDVFGGSGAVLDAVMKRIPDLRFVYNDKDEKIFNFFKVLQQKPSDLSHLCFLTPYGRKSFFDSYDILYNDALFNDLNDIDKALIFLIVNRQSFSAKMSKDWSITRNGEINYNTWNDLPEYILKVAKIWKSVYLENLDYKDLIMKWDSPSSILYCDPPYEGVEHDYYDINKEQGFNHHEMFNVLQSVKGSYCVSYYGANEHDDSDLIKQYKKMGCQIFRKNVKKHLSLQETKDTATELLIISNKSNKKLFGKNIRFQEIEEVTH